MSDAGAGSVAAGAEARALLARARDLADRGSEILHLSEVRRTEVRHHFKIVRERLIYQRLATIPIGRLREVTEGRTRIGAIERAGYQTVAAVRSASRLRLQQIPGVGETTARQAIAAAQQVASALEEEVRVELDPDRRSGQETMLLAALWLYDAAERVVPPIRDEVEALDERLTHLLRQGSSAANRLKFLFTGKRKKAEALAALGELDALLGSVDTIRLDDSLREAELELTQSLGDDGLWRDYEARAAEYWGLLGEIGDLNLDVEAAQGFLPAEIATRVNEQQLDDTYLRVALRGYQAFGAKFALVQRRSILGDEMGLGKTIEAITAIAHLRSLGATHFVAVCPASVLVNWTLEVHERSDLRAYRVHGSERETNFRTWVRQGGVAVTTYESLRALEPPDGVTIAMLIVDEAHYAKNPAAKRSQTVVHWAGVAERVLFLTGTPMENRVDEFRTLVGYLQPEVAKQVSGVNGIAGPIAFRQAVAPVYLRRNQADVLPELPERLEVADWLDLEAQDLVEYRVAVASGNFMAMRRAAFAAGDPTSSGKLARLMEIVEESAANDWKVVVFSYFRDVLRVVHEALGGAALEPITGSVAPTARQGIVDEFTAIDGHAVLVSQIQAGGVGLNIQAASVVVLTEPQWKPTVEDQAIARCHRMGQTRRVHVHRLLARDSVDERMLEIIRHKAQLFDDYARQSAVKDFAEEATDISEVEAARQIVAMEQHRLGIDPTSAIVSDDVEIGHEDADAPVHGEVEERSGGTGPY